MLQPKEKDELFEDIDYTPDIIDKPLEVSTKEAMMDYGTYIIEERAIPSALDGLKPVQRRCLYAIKEADGMIGTKTKKLVTPIGTAMLFHPHGDSSILKTYINMSQTFKNNFPVFNPQGSFGTIQDPEAHAAPRYIEISIKKPYADFFFDNMNKKGVVSWQPNFDGSKQEPKVFPIKLPWHLINGSSGIAYSMSTKIPSFNSKELINLIIQLIEDKFYEKEYELTEEKKDIYRNIVPAPDFPTGTNIYFDNETDKKNVLFQNDFKMRMRATYHIDEEKNMITFKNIPYETSLDNLEIELHNLRTKDGQNSETGLNCTEDIVSIADNIRGGHYVKEGATVNKDGMIQIPFKKGVDLYVELAKILKNTSLDKPFSSNIVVINEKGIPVKMSVFENMKIFTKFRAHIIKRTMEEDLKNINKRIHLLEAFFKLMENKEDFIQLVTKSESEEAAYENVINKYNFTKEQTDFALSLQIKKLNKKEKSLKEIEFNDLNSEKTKIEEIISTKENIYNYVKQEYTDLLNSLIFRDVKRNSKVLEEVMSLNRESLIKDKEIIINLMSDNTIGYIDNELKVRNRGTQSRKTSKQKDEIFVKEAISCRLKSELACLTTKGRIFKIKGYDIHTKYQHISNILNLKEDEDLAQIISLDGVSEDSELLFISKKGMGSKSTISFIKNSTKNRAIISMKLREDDELLSFYLVEEDSELLLLTKQGKGLKFLSNDITTTKSAGLGVYLYRTEKYEDEIVNAIIVNKADKEKDIVVVYEKGGIKKMNISSIKTKKRGQVGLIISKYNEEEGYLVDGCIIEDENTNILMISKYGESGIIKSNDIKSVSRTAKGIRKGLILRNKKDVVLKVFSIENETETKEEDSGIELKTEIID